MKIKIFKEEFVDSECFFPFFSFSKDGALSEISTKSGLMDFLGMNELTELISFGPV